MKRGIIAIILSIALLVSLSACTSKETEQKGVIVENIQLTETTLPPAPEYSPPPTAPDVIETQNMTESQAPSQ